MLQRSLTAFVGIPILVAAVWLGAPWLTVLVLVAGVAGVWELYRMTPANVGPLPVILGVAWVLALILGAQAASGRNNFLIISGGVIAAGSFASLLWFIAFYRTKGGPGPGSYLAGFCYLMGGPIYLGFFLAHALMLREIIEAGRLPGSQSNDSLGVALAVQLKHAAFIGEVLGDRSSLGIFGEDANARDPAVARVEDRSTD